MDHHPFTQEQATEIAEDFEDLIDTSFNSDGTSWDIAHVLVCPFGPAEKGSFISSYLESGEVASPDGPSGFDVAVIAIQGLGKPAHLTQDIRLFATNQGISYNFPGA